MLTYIGIEVLLVVPCPDRLHHHQAGCQTAEQGAHTIANTIADTDTVRDSEAALRMPCFLTPPSPPPDPMLPHGSLPSLAPRNGLHRCSSSGYRTNAPAAGEYAAAGADVGDLAGDCVGGVGDVGEANNARDAWSWVAGTRFSTSGLV